MTNGGGRRMSGGQACADLKDESETSPKSLLKFYFFFSLSLSRSHTLHYLSNAHTADHLRRHQPTTPSANQPIEAVTKQHLHSESHLLQTSVASTSLVIAAVPTLYATNCRQS
ncbi:hypothetical protein ACJW31_11G130800 [Castanea mollissima]